jgi:hypothetical protein
LYPCLKLPLFLVKVRQLSLSSTVVPNTMVFQHVKRALQYAKKYNCTIEMLYLDDWKMVVKSMDDVRGYDGKVSSCIDIVTKLCAKRRPTKVAKVLNEQYGMDMSHVHKCISIYLGGLGTMDDEYIRRYPESNLSSLGGTSMEYNVVVKNTVALATLLEGIELPEYSLDSFSVVYQFGNTQELDLDNAFDGMEESTEVALQYSRFNSVFASYNGDQKKIRRKISTTIGKNIPKRYVEFVPKTMDEVGVIMARWNGKDFKVYCDKFIFDCDGSDLNNVATYAEKIISTFNINKDWIVFAYQANTKASLQIKVDNWNAVVLEDLIINDDVLSRVMYVANGVLEDVGEALNRNRSLVVYITHPRARCVYRYANGFLKVSIASLSIDDTAIVVSVGVVWALLKKYKKNFAKVYEKYSLRTKKRTKTIANVAHHSKIDQLRERLPELFANNYTRECHNLPLMLDTEEEAEEYRKMGQLVIKYPLEGKYSKWYTSPTDDLYVGLKLNRLSNKSKFKYIINCYTSNHYNNPNRETYAYYHGGADIKRESATSLITLRILPLGRKGPLPIAMIVEYGLEGYLRVGTGGPFVDCVATALGVDAKKFHKLVQKGVKNGLLNVVRQEAWNKTDEEILDEISGDLDGKYYRLLEEVYECNILLVEIGHRSKYTISIPSCKGRYIWQPRKGKYIVVMKNEKKLYEDHLVSYELVVNRDKTTFGRKDPLVSAIVSFKLAHTVRGDVDEEVEAQYITEYGKCNIVMTKDGMKKCSSRPLFKPIINVEMVRKKSVVYNHLGSTPLSSTAKHLYFPNHTSFVNWYDNAF